MPSNYFATVDKLNTVLGTFVWFGDFTRSLVVSTSTIIEGATMCVVKSKSDFNQTFREAQERSCRAGNIWCLNIRHNTEIVPTFGNSKWRTVYSSFCQKWNWKSTFVAKVSIVLPLKKRKRQEDFLLGHVRSSQIESKGTRETQGALFMH